MNDIVAKGGVITATERMPKMKKKFFAFASGMARSVWNVV